VPSISNPDVVLISRVGFGVVDVMIYPTPVLHVGHVCVWPHTRRHAHFDSLSSSIGFYKTQTGVVVERSASLLRSGTKTPTYTCSPFSSQCVALFVRSELASLVPIRSLRSLICSDLYLNLMIARADTRTDTRDRRDIVFNPPNPSSRTNPLWCP